MTLLIERPATSSSTDATTPRTAGTTAADTAVRAGSYVTLPAGNVPAGVEGSYVTIAGTRNQRPATRGSYVTVDATSVAAGVLEGSYVTLPAAA